VKFLLLCNQKLYSRDDKDYAKDVNYPVEELYKFNTRKDKDRPKDYCPKTPQKSTLCLNSSGTLK